MKILTSAARIFVGLLFMFSGFIKSNDPKGTGIKLNEYFDVFASDFQRTQDSILISFSDNFGNQDSSWQYLNVNDSIKYLQVNRSFVNKVVSTESSEDTAATFDTTSSMSTELFIVLDDNNLFKHKYRLKDENDKHLVKIKVSTGSDSVLFSDNFIISSASKLEVVLPLKVYPFVQKEHILVGFFRGLKPLSVWFSVILCILEIVLGFAILIGWKPKLTAWAILITIVFFTFLTWYSAYYNKVTDCGCFGDFIKLEPWTSFYKDLVLLVFIVFLFIRRKHIVPLFSPLFSWNAMSVITIASTSFSVYCKSYLPVWDFLPYKVCNNINQLMVPPAGLRDRDSVQMVFIVEKDQVRKSLMMTDYMKAMGEGWKYVDRKDSIVIKAWKSPIHDFDFSIRDDNSINIKDSILKSDAWQILIISGDLKEANDDAWPDIQQLANDAKAKGLNVYAVTSSSLEEADIFVSEHQLPFKFNNADNVLLKTMMRSNPGIIFWHHATVMGKWSSRNIPKISKLEKLMQ